MLFRKKRIFAYIFSRLGNQQFQYAVVKGLAVKFNRQLILDDSYFIKGFQPVQGEEVTYPFKLTEYKISEPKTRGLLRKFIGVINRHPRIQDFYIRIQDFPIVSRLLPKLILSRNFQKSKEITKKDMQGKRDIIFADYGHSYKAILEEYESQFCSWFAPNFVISPENLHYLEIAQAPGTVSMHVRRGDYLKLSGYINLPLEYYQRALFEIQQRTTVSKLLIFSDDITWVKANMKFELPSIYVETDGPDHEHQYIMSQCVHNIIANSTFSWWAAMLNRNPDKIVCTAQEWFNDALVEEVMMISEGWIKIWS